MILIDTSAWIEFFRSRGDQRVKERVAAHMDLDEAAYTCPVLFELLVGASSSEEKTVRTALSFCKRLIFKPEFWEKAAGLDKTLRRLGITVPRDDVLAATVAKECNVPLLCKDKHFDLIQKTAAPSIEISQFA